MGMDQTNSGVPDASSATVMYMEHIAKRFSGVQALGDVKLEVRKGEVHGLIGEYGAGKSALMKIMSGVSPSFDGQLYFAGKPVTFGSTPGAQRHGVVIILQELNLVPELTVYENVFLGLEPMTRLGDIDRGRMRRNAADLQPHRARHEARPRAHRPRGPRPRQARPRRHIHRDMRRRDRRRRRTHGVGPHGTPRSHRRGTGKAQRPRPHAFRRSRSLPGLATCRYRGTGVASLPTGAARLLR